jgi:hypothetical protein
MRRKLARRRQFFALAKAPRKDALGNHLPYARLKRAFALGCQKEGLNRNRHEVTIGWP